MDIPAIMNALQTKAGAPWDKTWAAKTLFKTSQWRLNDFMMNQEEICPGWWFGTCFFHVLGIVIPID